MLTSPAIIVDSSIFPYNFISFSLTYFDALLLGISVGRTVMSSRRIDPFITIQCPSLFLINFLALKSVLSKIIIAIPAFFSLVLVWYILLHTFTFNLHVSLYLKWISCRQHIVRSFGNSLSFYLRKIFFSFFLLKDDFKGDRVLSCGIFFFFSLNILAVSRHSFLVWMVSEERSDLIIFDPL